MYLLTLISIFLQFEAQKPQSHLCRAFLKEIMKLTILIFVFAISTVKANNLLDEDYDDDTIETTTQDNCEWYNYADESENYDFQDCTEATTDDLNIKECRRVNYVNSLLEPGEKFAFADCNLGNCWGFHQCIKFCEEKIHKCTFQCNECLKNDEDKMRKGLFLYSYQKCIASYHQPCDQTDQGADACIVN